MMVLISIDSRLVNNIKKLGFANKKDSVYLYNCNSWFVEIAPLKIYFNII